MYSCEPLERVRDLTVDAVLEDAVAGLLVGGVLRTSSSKVAFASGIIAHSSPSISPALSNSAGSTGAARCRSSSLRESAKRLAGSIVSTATFWPREASPAQGGRVGGLADAPGAGADADPAVAEDVGDVRHQRTASSRQRPRELLQGGHVQLRLEDEGQRPDRHADAALQPLKLRALGTRPALLGDGRGERRLRRALGDLQYPRELLGLLLGKRSGYIAFM